MDENLTLCHYDVCRHTTGALCTSYLPIQGPPEHLEQTTAYEPGDERKWLFCSKCGCHLFRRRRVGDLQEWDVASGVITTWDDEQARFFSHHAGVEDTKDGGLSRWLTSAEQKSEGSILLTHPPQPFLKASCRCRTVSFRVARPSQESRRPRSNFPDLMYPYVSTDPDVVKNPGDEKWWLCEGDTKFLAGTCACASCRQVLGFEIQSWAFVPRSDISFTVGSGEDERYGPLDFEELHRRGALEEYDSSEGVVREFCPGCGATVFWHDRWRPDLIDVSIGLLRADSGALAEDWLDWFKGRVSFAEDAELGRTGAPAEWARRLLRS